MPEVNFSITGTGSVAFVKEWATVLGWQEFVLGVSNPTPAQAHIINYYFEQGKQLVLENRKTQAVADVQQDLEDEINSLNLEM